MPESSNPASIQVMLRLLGLDCRTARSSIYSEKAEIKSPRELLGSAGSVPRAVTSVAVRSINDAVALALARSAGAAEALGLTSLLCAL